MDYNATKERLRTIMETTLGFNQASEATNFNTELQAFAAGCGLTEHGLALFCAWAACKTAGDMEAGAMADKLNSCSGRVFLG